MKNLGPSKMFFVFINCIGVITHLNLIEWGNIKVQTQKMQQKSIVTFPFPKEFGFSTFLVHIRFKLDPDVSDPSYSHVLQHDFNKNLHGDSVIHTS